MQNSIENLPKTARAWAFVLGIGLTALLGLILALSGRLASKAADSEMLSWTGLEQKEKAAALLNQGVRSPEFKAEVLRIAQGENFWALARRFKINIDTVLAANPDLEGLYAKLGQPLLLLNQRGAVHQVKAGESLDSIAALYGLKAGEIKKANRIGWFGLKPLQLLFIPGARPKQLGQKLGEVYRRRNVLRSPLKGRYTSVMGTRSDPFTGAVTHHNGVDIKAPYNELVSAAAPGKVVFAGWNGGYGKCIKIDHQNGYVTLYGHLNSIQVHVGQRIRQYQVIGKVGSTGRATGSHLHFTIYYQGKVKNPLEFLW